MVKAQRSENFATLFKKYRLRSEIETLSQFGELLAQEGLIYENSLYTHWQKGDRTPKDRKTLLAVIKVLFNKKGIESVKEANELLKAIGHRDLTEQEIQKLLHDIDSIPFKSSLVSLPELLRTYRIQKHLSLYETALSAGLKDEKLIEDIEKGIVEVPPRELIDKICEALQLKESEKNALLYAGSYLPTDTEVAAIRENVKSRLESWPYPALLYDVGLRTIMANVELFKCFSVNKSDAERFYRSNISAMEILFDPDFVNNKHLSGADLAIWNDNLVRVIVHFRSLHKSATKQQWYISLIKKMMKNDLFREKWKKAEQINGDYTISRYGSKVIFEPGTKRKYKFNVFDVPLLNDPRFEIEFYTPADSQTFSYYQK